MVAENIIRTLNSPDSIHRLVSAATTNATVVKATPGLLTGYIAGNINAAVRYLKIYDIAVAPTVGTTVPKLTIHLPASGVTNYPFPHPISFNTGIAIALTTGLADADTGAVALSEITVHILYK